METPEYLALFSNKGNIIVEVKFKDYHGGVANLKMMADEIIKLTDPSSHEFLTEMRFDDWLFEIYKYQIDPLKKKITIMVRNKEGEIYP